MSPFFRSLCVRAAAFALVLTLAPRIAHASVFGAIEGVVIDQGTKKPIAGVTVTVTSPALQGEQTEFTDNSGHYIITDLPPGDYTVRGYFSNIQVERSGLFLHADQTLAANLVIPTAKGEVKTYHITERAPSVDIGSAQQATVVTSELYNNAPFTTGAGANGYGAVQQRDFSSLLSVVPSQNNGTGAGTNGRGSGFGGATAAENQYQLDGLNVSEVTTGIQALHLSVEFLKELDVVTGGFNAEHGGATGAVVNAVTKSGSNEFHGDVWFYYTPQSLTPPAIGGLAQAIATTGVTKYALDFGADIGGPIVKDRIWFYLGVAPSIGENDSTVLYRRRTADMVPSGFMGAYAGDTTTIGTPACPAYLAARQLCPSGNLANQTFNLQSLNNYTEHDKQTLAWYNWIAKLDFQLSPNNHLSVEYIGSPTTSEGTTAGSGPVESRTSNQYDISNNVIAHMTSKVLNRKLQLDVHAGYYNEHYYPTFSGAALSEPSVSYRGSYPLAQFQPGISECTPTTPSAGVTFNPCPVSNYAVGGVGGATETTTQRFAASATAVYFLSAWGTHALKLGGDIDWSSEQNLTYHTNGATYRVNTDGSVGENLFASVKGDTVTILPNGATATTTSLSGGAYLRDSWNVGFVRGLTVNLGVRWDGQQLKGDDGKAYINLTNNWAPRLGVAYDWTRKGLSRIYANYGIYYESVPLTLMDVDFTSARGTLNNIRALPNTCQKDANGLVIISSCQFPTTFKTSQVAFGSVALVAPNLAGQSSNEFVGGVDYDVGWDMIVGVSYTHRALGNIIDDASPTGNGNNIIVGNPGAPVDAGAVTSLQNQITATTDPMKKSMLQQQLQLYRAMSSEGKPIRNYDAVQFSLTKRLSHHFIVNASYVYSRSTGNYPGTYDTGAGRLSPNSGPQYDFRSFAGQPNSYGPLAQDTPHVMKIAGSYQVPYRNNMFTFGATFFGASGHPIDVLGNDAAYGLPETFILPRGAGGRTPFLTQLNLHVGVARQFTKRMRGELYGDVFNVLNEQAVTSVSQVYTQATVTGINGGTPADLRGLRDVNGAPVLINPNFGQPTGYQNPLSARFGARVSF